MSLPRHLKAMVDAEVARGTRPLDVIGALLGAVTYALRRAGHTNVDNMAVELAAIIIRGVNERAEP